MKKFQNTILALLVLWSSTLSVQGEDVNAEAEDNYRSEVQVCSDSVIEVQDVSIVCDSPGTYYYGSGKYRNSYACQPGDKGKIEIDFYIADPDTLKSAGGYALVTVDVDGGWFTQSYSVYENADLCSLSSLKSLSGSTCPFEGYYRISTQFYWDNQNQNSGSSFVPTVSVGFKSSLNKGVYDYGGANTNLCTGSSFITWSDGVRKSYANALSNFIRSFGILLFTILGMAVFIWFLAARPKSLAEARAKLPHFRFRKDQEAMEEEFDFSKMHTAGNRDLVDF
jgi:hypothetical protein